MRHESIPLMFKQYHDNKKNGVKHTPLHTLQECCEAAGIDPRVFGRWAAQHSGAPQPVLTTSGNVSGRGKKYYRKTEFVNWVTQIRNQKEKAMPDIKTALQKALAKTATDWAADDEAHQKINPTSENTMTIKATTPEEKTDKRITNNVSRETFYFVKNNPGMTQTQATVAMVEKGYKLNSVASLLGQMLRSRMIMEDDQGRLSAVVKDYMPVQAGRYQQRKAKDAATKAAQAPRKKIVLIKRKADEPVIGKPEPTMLPPSPTLPTLPAPTTAEGVLASLSVAEAHKLYTQLRNIFGG